MTRIPFVVLSCVLSCILVGPVVAQKRVNTKQPTFPEAIDAAQKAVAAGELGSAISALQAAIRDLQRKQRLAILEALPAPAGWQVEDDAEEQTDQEIQLGAALMGLTVRRHCTRGDQRIDVEVTANSPMLQTMAMLFSNPMLIKADGGELVEYGAHKAILKGNTDDGVELQVLMHGKHLVRVSAQGVGADDVLKVIDQAAIDRLEKPLGK